MGESVGRLVLQSSDLGSCYYNLHLKATVSKPEKPLYFCTTLGSSQTITTKIVNYARQKTEYLLQVSPACPGLFAGSQLVWVASAPSVEGSCPSSLAWHSQCGRMSLGLFPPALGLSPAGTSALADGPCCPRWSCFCRVHGAWTSTLELWRVWQRDLVGSGYVVVPAGRIWAVPMAVHRGYGVGGTGAAPGEGRGPQPARWQGPVGVTPPPYRPAVPSLPCADRLH